MDKLFAKNGDPDQRLHSAASDLGLHCLPITFLRDSRLQWISLSLNSKESFSCGMAQIVFLGKGLDTKTNTNKTFRASCLP